MSMIAAGANVCLLSFRIEDLRKIAQMTSLVSGGVPT